MNRLKDDESEDQSFSQDDDLLGGLDLPDEEPSTDETDSDDLVSLQDETPGDSETEPSSIENEITSEQEPVATPSAEQPPTTKPSDEIAQEFIASVSTSTLASAPPGYRVTQHLGLIHVAVLRQSPRIEDMPIQDGLDEAVHELKKQAVAKDGNAIIGIHVNVTPLGQLYPDSVWICATGTCCRIVPRARRNKSSTKQHSETNL